MSRYRQTMAEALRKVYEQDDKDHEISMARGELEAIADKATQLAGALQGKSDEGNPLEAWVQSKITKAKDYINSVSDYMMYNPDMKQNEETILEFTQQQIKQAYGILNDPRYKSGNYDGAVAAIEKLAKGLSKHPDVANALKRANEEVELGEATSHTVRFTDPLNKKRFAIPFKTHAAAEKKMAQLKKDGVKEINITMDELKPGIKFAEGTILEKTYSSKEIDQFHTGLDQLVHKHFGHSSDEKKSVKEVFTSNQIKDLQKAYADLKGKTISPEKATMLSKKLDGYDVASLRQLHKANIPFVSTVARNKIYKQTGKFESLDEALDDFGLKGKITDAQLKNIKDVWAKKTKMDITPGVKAMIARMDIPTKLAIQHAKINVLSDLVKEDTDTIEEGRIKDIFTANQEGESIEKIAKRLNMSVADVKKILGEETLEEQDGVEIAKIRAERDKDDNKEVASKDKEIESLKDQINILKTKLENEKNKVIKPEPNPDTGEIPLTVGIAHKILKDKREKEMKKEDVQHPAKTVFESISAVKKKAEKTGMPYSILKQVYDRGMAAWKGGHRPGATQVQWALARVNSFVTKSSGTWGGADSDLAKKVKGEK